MKPKLSMPHIHHAGALAILVWMACTAHALPSLETTGSGPSELSAWPFNDPVAWTNSQGYYPRSFTNVMVGSGNGSAALINGGNTNTTWLAYNIVEATGHTNLSLGSGCVMFWYCPGWSSVDQSGAGPGSWARLLEVGTNSINASNGWWSLYLDPAGQNIYFGGQANGTNATYLTAPISWNKDQFHFIGLAYSSTNSVLCIDGDVATNGVGVSCLPGQNALTNGFFIGSDSSGAAQACGTFDDITTYNGPLSEEMMNGTFRINSLFYLSKMPPQVHGAPSTPATGAYKVITGTGYLQPVALLSGWMAQTNVWITNICYSASNNGTFTFGIAGGTAGCLYDLFASGYLIMTNGPWSWMGQGSPGNVYSVSNLASSTTYFILGTGLDADFDGLTDAYERLVSHTDAHNPDTDGDGIPDGWAVLLGLNALGNSSAQPDLRSNYSYDSTDWLRGISGVKTGSVGLDSEGNVLSVSQ